MGVEKLIIGYGIVCVAMILFNFVCIYYFRRRDQKTRHVSRQFVERIDRQINDLRSSGKLSADDLSYLYRKLKDARGLMSFELALDEIISRDSSGGSDYIKAIHSVFLRLGQAYLKRETAEGIYFLHILVKYRVCSANAFDILDDLMFEYIKKPGIHICEKALEVLCQTKQEAKLVSALVIINERGAYLPERLLTTLLLGFEGSSKQLIDLLLANLNWFRLETKKAVIALIDRKSNDYSEMMFNWLQTEQEDEVRYALLRYFGGHWYGPAYDVLCSLAEDMRADRWVDTSIAVTVLRNYPGEATIPLLKRALTSANWYVRFDAAESLEALGVTYNELSDILNGGDRFAREMITYHTERTNLGKEAILP